MPAKPPTIKLKRAYESPSKSDGRRILVERLWPRGIKKEDAALFVWLREIAPSTELRKWYDHDPTKWPGFQKRYLKELAGNGEQVARLCEVCAVKTVTFVFAAKDETRNSAVVLKRYIENLA
jgi:uncharacterized protein YeaO (DUF488 family)